ncbi:MAG: polyphosphate polymerase domain-containing protein, partial [Anaerolineae bacterium]
MRLSIYPKWAAPRYSAVPTKYLLNEDQLSRVLARLVGHYRMLEIDGRRLHNYQTLYFDTQGLTLYQQHHNGWRNRYKVRERVYADSDLAFLEIKQKTNTDTTIKSCRRTQALSSQLPRNAPPFLRRHYPYRVEELEAKLFNVFQRITLVSTHSVERLTVDVGLQFSWNGVCVPLTGIAIAEVKQDGFSMDSEFIRQMRAEGVRATSFSKYCIGVSMLYPEVKHNRFKPQLRQIDKL